MAGYTVPTQDVLEGSQSDAPAQADAPGSTHAKLAGINQALWLIAGDLRTANGLLFLILQSLSTGSGDSQDLIADGMGALG